MLSLFARGGGGFQYFTCWVSGAQFIFLYALETFSSFFFFFVIVIRLVLAEQGCVTFRFLLDDMFTYHVFKAGFSLYECPFIKYSKHLLALSV